jgi:N-acetylglucosamine-6-phosphate deacetylase
VHVPAGKSRSRTCASSTAPAPRLEDQTLLLDGAKIAAVQAASAPIPSSYSVIDGTGETALPGLVGMHNHLFYLQRPNLDASGHSEQPIIVPQMTFSAPRLYLANGVTTMRTTRQRRTGHRPQPEARDRRRALVGPHLDVTGPYLEGAGAFFIQNHMITSPDDARREVAYWAGQA